MKTPESGGAERRSHRRIPRSVPVTFLEFGGMAHSCIGQLQDLSMGGAGMLCDRAVPAGRRLVVGMELDTHDDPLVARAVVRRCVPRDDGFLVGLEFLWLGFDQRRALAVLREHLEASGVDTRADSASGSLVGPDGRP